MDKSMTIPECRAELRSIIRRLRLIERQMYRRSPKRKAAPESSVMTPYLKGKIRQYARKHSTASYKKIGDVFNVSIGRVSEALAGKRGKK